MEIPHRFDLDLEQVDPIQIRSAPQEGKPLRYPTLPKKVLHHTFPDGGKLYIFRAGKNWVFLVRGDHFSPTDTFSPAGLIGGWTSDTELGAVARTGEVVLHYMDERIVFDLNVIRDQAKRARAPNRKTQKTAH
jgi:hypothetical protein